MSGFGGRVAGSAYARSTRGRSAAVLLAAALAAGCCASAGSPADTSDGADGTETPSCAPASTCRGGCCAPGEACTSDGCCAPERACQGTCCGVAEVCEAGSCRTDCTGAGPRCGSPEGCCVSGEVCYLGACTTPGANCVAAGEFSCAPAPCPDGQYCEATIGRCLPVGPSAACEYAPPVGDFDPVIEWQWTPDPLGPLPTYDGVIHAPAVADLDGDCMPDIVFQSFEVPNTYGSYCDSVLRAVSGDGSRALFTVDDPSLRTGGQSGIAIGDADLDGRPEIFACSPPPYSECPTGQGAVLAFHNDGTLLWRWTNPRVRCGLATAPALADLDQDGRPELLVRYAVLDAATGSVRFIGRANTEVYGVPEDFVTAADLDGDGLLDLVGGNEAWRLDGTVLWDQSASLPDGAPAVADLDGDGSPEVVSVQLAGPTLYALHGDGSVMWGPADTSGGRDCGLYSNGAPPTIADFDGDGRPDVGVVGCAGYVAFRGRDGAVMWTAGTLDSTLASTGSSVFDFDGDSQAEVVYNDETRLRIFNGADGRVLWETCNTSATVYELPVIVDVDADDHAEIVVVGNDRWARCLDGSSNRGLRVIGDRRNNWVRTRRVWNQHTYHVTNIDDDLRVPRAERPNWATPGLNNFRQNVQTAGLLAAPDLVPVDFRAGHYLCSTAITLAVWVQNRGAAGAPAGVPVAFFRAVGADPRALLGVARTTQVLLPGESQQVELTWTADAATLEQAATAEASVDDDGSGTGIVHECDETNNAAAPIAIGCSPIG